MPRCNFFWERYPGVIVQCQHIRGHQHIRHEFEQAWVYVGSEIHVKGYWLNT